MGAAELPRVSSESLIWKPAFDWILGEVTGRSGMVDFLMSEPAKCPKCFRGVTEKTLVEW